MKSQTYLKSLKSSKMSIFNCSSESHLVRGYLPPTNFTRANPGCIRALNESHEQIAAPNVLEILRQELAANNNLPNPKD